MSDPAELRGALGDQVAAAVGALRAAHEAREAALPAARRVIQLAGSAIKAVHRRESATAEAHCAEAEAVLRTAQAAVADQPAIAHAGFLADAEKEYVEARCVIALVDGGPLPDSALLGVGAPAWLKGVAEAASELRRHLLDRLRAGELEAAETMFARMEDTYDALMEVDFPDAVTGGLRRTLDALRGVLERTRANLTTTVLQVRLQRAVQGGTDS